MTVLNAVRRAWYRVTTCRANTGSDSEGYAHWYCQHRRWHRPRTPAKGLVAEAQMHRYRNYVWPEGGKTRYEPIPPDMRWPRCDRIKPELGPRVPRPLPPHMKEEAECKAAER
jgi:hypothetical protein